MGTFVKLLLLEIKKYTKFLFKKWIGGLLNLTEKMLAISALEVSNLKKFKFSRSIVGQHRGVLGAKLPAQKNYFHNFFEKNNAFLHMLFKFFPKNMLLNHCKVYK